MQVDWGDRHTKPGGGAGLISDGHFLNKQARDLAQPLPLLGLVLIKINFGKAINNKRMSLINVLTRTPYDKAAIPLGGIVVDAKCPLQDAIGKTARKSTYLLCLIKTSSEILKRDFKFLFRG